MGQHFSTWLTTILVLAVVFGPGRADAFSCTEALTELLPCQRFLVGRYQITISCCQGVYAFRQAAASQTDKKAICRCLKQAALSAQVRPLKVERLEQFCKIRNVPVVIGSNFDCDAWDLLLWIPSPQAASS